MSFVDLINAYAVAARENLIGPGQREAALAGPVADLIRDHGTLLGHRVSAHNEVTVAVGVDGREMVRPDFGVRVDSVLNGHIELKAPGTSLDPGTYRPKSHNGRQWLRLKELPNLLHTNGVQWRLWRYGEPVAEERSLHVKDLRTFRGTSVGFQAELERLLTDFLTWQPAPITSVSKLVGTLGPLTRLLREEVLDVLKEERRAARAGASRHRQPITALHQEWRRVLSPGADEAQFADGFAQTVVFALVLAVSEGLDVGHTPLSELAAELDEQYGVMGRSLSLVAPTIRSTPVQTAVETITRTLSAVDWPRMAAGRSDVYLHLYEHFLSAYDPQLKEASGSYYTPVELVDPMVQWADEAVRTHLHRPRGLRDAQTQVIDPAMGTGTYPLSVLRRVAGDAAAEYGPGAAAEAVSGMAERLYGIELQSGPFSVAELRISQAIKEAGATVPADGMKLFIGDTLEDPAAKTSREGLSYTAALIAQQRVEANRVKRDENIQVVIGNPPYKDKAGGRGGWIESGVDPSTGTAPLAAFKAAGHGRHAKHLNNLYVYFWRWAAWKAFESTAQRHLPGADQGVLCFVTAAGYLTGPGFAGMREYLRRTCTAGWVINVTPEGINPPPGHGVFAIKTPVAVGVFVRGPQADPDVPAPIRYRDVQGTRAEKFEQLPHIYLNGDGWREASTDWQASFTPASGAAWSSFPSVRDLYPWYSPGLKPNRTWVYSPSPDALQYRLNTVVAETDPTTKSVLFKETRDTTLTTRRPPLPAQIGPDEQADTYQHTDVPFVEETAIPDAKIVQVGFRSFDRQWVIADARLIHDCRRPLWEGRISEQVYLTELHTEFPRCGPGVSFTALIPDMHHFRGSGGGRVHPMLHPDGTPNLPKGLVEALNTQLGGEITGPDVTSYVAGLLSHPGYVRHFDDELHTPGARVPITADPGLWNHAVELGRKVLWCHTYGAAGSWNAAASVTAYEEGLVLPQYARSMGQYLPRERAGYDVATQTLTLGAGTWTHVTSQVRDYTVGGENVIDGWVSWRTTTPGGKKTSPLDSITADRWAPQWSAEFTELLCALTRLVVLEPAQSALLAEVLERPTISRSLLAERGVVWPPPHASEAPRR